mmetsp:Transcript_66760/g.186166  ORF Transcript_66760/g.186166 Transcript_66760/m.186166 type:complete len:285 (+) Transcript_66760:127-981(+)|eukprot:CAMPEP_0117543290 /NCGR_PEP_ID=MMETSP0784-20121206/44985_1 /TAXON_ID=39447 /ORGANISM="" /LENGTH=284 /DNA_ID=CAMNT_0005340065 /DNA_START=127 /DNA_END=981 /DNA_ORIENTATION=+
MGAHFERFECVPPAKCGCACLGGDGTVIESGLRKANIKAMQSELDSQRGNPGRDRTPSDRKPVSEAAVVNEFKDNIFKKCASLEEGFERLGGNKEGYIDLELWFDGDEEKINCLFDFLDRNKNGHISWEEFARLASVPHQQVEAFPVETGPKQRHVAAQPASAGNLLAQLPLQRKKVKEMTIVKESSKVLRDKFRTCQHAFSKLRGNHKKFNEDGVDIADFKRFYRKELGYNLADDVMIERLFHLIDKDNDGRIMQSDFEAHFAWKNRISYASVRRGDGANGNS